MPAGADDEDIGIGHRRHRLRRGATGERDAEGERYPL
jgi:hypothetical protein